MRVLRVLLIAGSLAAYTGAYTQQKPAEPAEPRLEPRGVPVIGRVVWPEHDLSAAQIRVYADPQLKKLLDAFPSGGKSGAVMMALGPGTYYLMAVADVDADGKLGPGDGVGFYGVTDANSPPQPFVVDEGAGALSVVIPVSFKVGANGKALEPVPVQAPRPCASDKEATVSGKVAGFGEPLGTRVVLAVPVSSPFPPRAALAHGDGSFQLSVVPGTYHIIAIEKLTEGNYLEAGDLMGIHRYQAGMGPSLPTIRLAEGQQVTDVQLDLSWALASDGRLRSGDGSVLGPRVNLGTLPAVCIGSVTRFGEPVPGAIVRAFADEALTQQHAAVKTDAQGRFCLALAPATYFLAVLRDVNSDGATGQGDELGFYGLTETNLSGKPAPLDLHGGEFRTGLAMPLVMVVSPDTTPVPLQAAAASGASQGSGGG